MRLLATISIVVILLTVVVLQTNGFVVHHGSRSNNKHHRPKATDGPTCEPEIDDEQRFDCYPEYGASESACISRGCCWRPPKFDKLTSGGLKFDKKNRNYLLNVPYCYYPTGFPNYQVIATKAYKNGYSYTLAKANATFRPNELLKLEARILLETSQRARVQIVDPQNDRYQVPLFDESERVYDEQLNADNTDFQFYVHQDPFYIQIFRKSTGRMIFDTSVAPMIYADQYIEFSTSLPTNYFYGIGEHRDNMAHTATWKSFTLWNRDFPPTVNTNLYGTHPFYMSIESDKNAFGFYLLNSNAMDINVQPTPALTFITIGGIVDFYIYMGPTPGDVVRQHTGVVGRSAFPPYWTLGFHLCRWRYDSSTRLREIVERNRAALMPYDTQWTDIDGMSAQMDWTYDQKDFAGLPDLVDDLHAHGQHYVNIIDPAISVTGGYEPYESGLESDVFIKMANSDEPLVGIVWPGKTVFPDFTHPNVTKWWTSCAAKFHQAVKFDGIWIDMNEPSNFVDGSMVGCFENSTLDRPPYTPKVLGNQLSAKTVCPSARQHLSSHYNLHNMYGHFEAKATYNALLSLRPGKRPFVLTRSSFAGTGKYSAHWSGDNRANWEDLYYSIPSMLNFNMFGVSMVGSDICGFSDNTTEELCVRWMQLGSFYPFMRNHNANNANDQDPAAFGLEAQSAMRKALQIRYSILPYMYTLFYKSTSLGDTVARPLFFEFTTDPNTHMIDRQFMLGPALLVTPVLDSGAVSVRGYFPPSDTWFKFVTGQRLDTSETPYQVIDAPLDEINVHIRSGHIVATQRPSLTTVQSRKNPFVLVVALKTNESDGSQSAAGNLFWDDGESLDSIDSRSYNFFNLLAKKGSLIIDRILSGYKTQMTLEEVKVYDVRENVNSVTINGDSYDNFIYDDIHKILRIQYFNIDMMDKGSIVINWS